MEGPFSIPKIAFWISKGAFSIPEGAFCISERLFSLSKGTFARSLFQLEKVGSSLWVKINIFTTKHTKSMKSYDSILLFIFIPTYPPIGPHGKVGRVKLEVRNIEARILGLKSGLTG